MHHLMNALLLVGAMVFISGIVMAVRAHLENRRGKAEPCQDYFGPQYDRDLLQLSAFSETEDLPAGLTTAFRLAISVIPTLQGGLLGSPAQPNGIANGIDPGIIHTATADGIPSKCF